jgi:hypothetical protein
MQAACRANFPATVLCSSDPPVSFLLLQTLSTAPSVNQPKEALQGKKKTLLPLSFCSYSTFECTLASAHGVGTLASGERIGYKSGQRLTRQSGQVGDPSACFGKCRVDAL